MRHLHTVFQLIYTRTLGFDQPCLVPRDLAGMDDYRRRRWGDRDGQELARRRPWIDYGTRIKCSAWQWSSRSIPLGPDPAEPSRAFAPSAHCKFYGHPGPTNRRRPGCGRTTARIALPSRVGSARVPQRGVFGNSCSSPLLLFLM